MRVFFIPFRLGTTQHQRCFLSLLTVLLGVSSCTLPRRRGTVSRPSVYESTFEGDNQMALSQILSQILDDSERLIDDIEYSSGPAYEARSSMVEFGKYAEDLSVSVENGNSTVAEVDDGVRRLESILGDIAPLMRSRSVAASTARIWTSLSKKMERLKGISSKVDGDIEAGGERIVPLIDELESPVSRLRMRARQDSASRQVTEILTRFKDDLDESSSRLEQDLSNRSLVLSEASKLVERWRKVRNILWEQDPSIFDSSEWNDAHQKVRNIQRELRRLHWQSSGGSPQRTRDRRSLSRSVDDMP
jgi:hypothetical protein